MLTRAIRRLSLLIGLPLLTPAASLLPPPSAHRRYAKMAGTRTNPAGIKVEIPDTTPMHTDYLMWAQEKGFINQALLDSV